MMENQQSKGLTDIEFVQLLLEWREAEKQQLERQKRINAYVLRCQKSQVIGDVSVTYRKGRTTYDYQGKIDQVMQDGLYPDSAMDAYTKVIRKVDYRAACEGLGIPQTEIPHKMSAPTVTIKLEQ